MKRCSLCLEEVTVWQSHCFAGSVVYARQGTHMVAMPHELTLDNKANYYRCGARVEYTRRFFYVAGEVPL